jgi:hypothetical protein
MHWRRRSLWLSGVFSESCNGVSCSSGTDGVEDRHTVQPRTSRTVGLAGDICMPNTDVSMLARPWRHRDLGHYGRLKGSRCTAW